MEETLDLSFQFRSIQIQMSDDDYGIDTDTENRMYKKARQNRAELQGKIGANDAERYCPQGFDHGMRKMHKHGRHGLNGRQGKNIGNPFESFFRFGGSVYERKH